MNKQSQFNKQWQTTIGNITSTIWLYTISCIATGLVSITAFALAPEGMIERFMNTFGDTSENDSFRLTDDLILCFYTLIAIGYYLFLFAIGKFARLQKTDADKAAVNRIKKAYIFLIAGVVIGFVPTFGCFIKLICILASYIMLLFGYDALRKSSAQASEAQKGAAKLRSATITMLIGSIMGCVPLFGSIIDGVLTFIAFFMVLSGWDAIKHGVPNLSEEEAEAALLHEEEKHPTPRMPKPEIQGYLLLALMAIQMIFSVWNNISTIPEYLYIPISNSVLLIVYLCYKKANLKGKFLVAICIALLTQIYAVIIPSIFSIESLECIYAIMIGNMFYILSLLVFVLPSRMNMGLKAAFIFMSSGALISFEFSFASWCVDTLQDAGLATGAIYAGFQIAHFLIIAFFVWRNHKQFTANSATPLSANTDRNSEA